MTFEFTWEDNNATCVFRKDIYLDDLLESSNYLIGSKHFDLIQYLIFDLRQVENYCLNKNDIRIVSNIDKGASRWNRNIRMACIPGTDKKSEVLLKEYIELMKDSSWKIELFKTLEEALVWCKTT